MAKRAIQRTSEVLMFAGDEFDLFVPVNNEDGTAIDLTAGSVSDVELKVYADIGSTTAALTKAGVLDNSVANGRLQFSFADTDTSTLTPKSYIYQVSFQFDGDQLMAGRDLFTIKRRV